jgi:hypothetical protein
MPPRKGIRGIPLHFAKDVTAKEEGARASL